MGDSKEKGSDPVVYICIDCEASGPVPGIYNLVSLGAVAVVAVGDGRRHKVLDDQLYLELKPAFDGFQREAMNIHKITRKHLEEEGLDPREAMDQLRKWALKCRRSKKDHLVFVGHNAPFDWSYISYYFVHTKVRNPFGYKALDTKALAMGVLGVPWLATTKETIEKHCPQIGREDKKQKHRADYDARYQAEILVALLDYKRPGGGSGDR